MKKTFIVLAAMLVISIAAKAWEVGDFYDQDPTGVPAVVVYVDESGEHGLIMSPKAFTEKGYKKSLKTFEGNHKWAQKDMAKKIKKAKKEGEDVSALENLQSQQEANYSKVMDFLSNAPRFFDGKLSEKEQRKVIEGFASQNNEFGEENQKNVIAYCQENNVDLTKFLPQYDYALNLGEGWFIPGNYELELFSRFFVDEMGEKHHIPFQKKMDMDKAQREKLGPVGDWLAFNCFFATDLIQSSTMIKSAWAEDPANKEKIDVQVVNSGWDFKDNYFTFCAFSRKLTMYYWWTFAKNLQGNSHVVAFKRF